MIRCPYCGHANLEGTIFCEECGEPFMGPEGALATRGPTTDPKNRASSPSAVEDQQEEEDLSDWMPGFAAPERIYLHIEHVEQHFVVDMFDAPVILGRADPREDFVPDIELTPFGAHDMGVSRRHAMISWTADGVMIEDLGSANGTYLNGHRLGQGSRRLLRDGDVVVLSELMLRIYFE